MNQFKNKIVNGNCAGILESIESDSIDCTITSPPYDNLRDYNKYEFDVKSVAQQLYRVTKDGGVVVWVVGDAVIDGSETGTSFEHALTFRDIGWKIHDTLIYEKNTSSFPARKNGSRYTNIFEYMFCFSKGKPKTHHLICDKPNKWAGWINWGKKTFRGKDGELKEQHDIKPVEPFSPRNNIWRYVPVGWTSESQEEFTEFYRYVPIFERDEEADDVIPSNIKRYVVGGKYGQVDKDAYQHPATFPLQLAADHILTWTNPGDVVLDPMCGSGTTPLAAKILNRQFIGIDISKEYCDLAQKRLDNSEEIYKKFMELQSKEIKI